MNSAILYGSGGAEAGRPRVNHVSRPVTKLVRAGPITCGSALEPCGVLIGVQPRAQVLGGVEPVDRAIFAGARVPGSEDLDAEMAGVRARRGDDPGEEPLVGAS